MLWVEGQPLATIEAACEPSEAKAPAPAGKHCTGPSTYTFWPTQYSKYSVATKLSKSIGAMLGLKKNPMPVELNQSGSGSRCTWSRLVSILVLLLVPMGCV